MKTFTKTLVITATLIFTTACTQPPTSGEQVKIATEYCSIYDGIKEITGERIWCVGYNSVGHLDKPFNQPVSYRHALLELYNRSRK